MFGVKSGNYITRHKAAACSTTVTLTAELPHSSESPIDSEFSFPPNAAEELPMANCRRRRTRLQPHVSKGLAYHGVDAIDVLDISGSSVSGENVVSEVNVNTKVTKKVDLFAVVNKELFASPPDFETAYEIAVELSHFLLKGQKRRKWSKFTFRTRRNRYQTYVQVGADFANEGRYEEALEKYFKALRLKAEDLVSMMTFDQTRACLLEVAVSINNIAFIYQNRKERFGLVEIAKLYECSLYIKLYVYEAEKYDTVGAAWNNIGAVYFQAENYLKALHCFRKARNIFRDFFAIDHLDICMVTCNIGDVYYRLGDWVSAVREYRSSLRLLWILLGPYDNKVLELMHRLATVEMKMAQANVPAANELEYEYDDEIDDNSFAAEVNALNVDIQKDLKFFETALKTAHGEFAKDHISVFRELRLLRCTNTDSVSHDSGNDVSLTSDTEDEVKSAEGDSTSSDLTASYENPVAHNHDDDSNHLFEDDVPKELLDGLDDLNDCLQEFEAMCCSAETNTLDGIATGKGDLSGTVHPASLGEPPHLPEKTPIVISENEIDDSCRNENRPMEAPHSSSCSDLRNGDEKKNQEVAVDVETTTNRSNSCHDDGLRLEESNLQLSASSAPSSSMARSFVQEAIEPIVIDTDAKEQGSMGHSDAIGDTTMNAQAYASSGSAEPQQVMKGSMEHSDASGATTTDTDLEPESLDARETYCTDATVPCDPETNNSTTLVPGSQFHHVHAFAIASPMKYMDLEQRRLRKQQQQRQKTLKSTIYTTSERENALRNVRARLERLRDSKANA